MSFPKTRSGVLLYPVIGWHSVQDLSWLCPKFPGIGFRSPPKPCVSKAVWKMDGYLLALLADEQSKLSVLATYSTPTIDTTDLCYFLSSFFFLFNVSVNLMRIFLKYRLLPFCKSDSNRELLVGCKL